MDLGLKGLVVVITGASGGIGRALAEAFAAEDASLVLTSVSRLPELESWVAGQPWRARALALRADVTQPAEIGAALEAACARFGRVDACVANAGRWTPEFALLHQADEQRVRASIDTNLMGSLWTARAFFAGLARSGPRSDGAGASLVLIGSTAGRFGEKGHAEYAVSKAGLYGLVRTLKNEIVELDPHGRVNMIEPGWTVTHMARPALDEPGRIAKVVRTMPLRQLARAKDIARAACFLCSPVAARHVSGEVLTIAGGMEGRVLWDPADVDEAAVRARLRRD
ncbi:MAG: SDR family NAD(P)-dependent oxidoreductase [Planctomycetota bacterium]